MLSERLVERLKAVADGATRLPPDAQDALAEQIASALDNALWDVQLHDPQDLRMLRKLAKEAKQEPRRPLPVPSDMGDEDAVAGDDRTTFTVPQHSR